MPDPSKVYWDKPDLADDLREMGDSLFPGVEQCLRRAMLYSAARRIEYLEQQSQTKTEAAEFIGAAIIRGRHG